MILIVSNGGVSVFNGLLEINKQSVAVSWSDILLKWYYFGISELAFTKHLDPQHKFNEQKTFIWHPGRDMNILLTFNLDCITTGSSVTQLLAVKVSFDYFSNKQIKKLKVEYLNFGSKMLQHLLQYDVFIVTLHTF